MAAARQKKRLLMPEEKLDEALIPNTEEPYSVPLNWCWTKMGVVAKWGSGGTPSRKNDDYYNGTIPWVKTGELNDDYIWETEEHISEQAIADSSAKLFPINTIIIAMYGATIGKVGILGLEATTNQACACGVSSAVLLYKYLFYYARSQKEAFIGMGKGGAQPNISQEIIKEHPIPLPPLTEQQRIVDRIESLFTKLDEAKEKAQAVVDGFEDRKAAILHKAFAGELTSEWRKKNGAKINAWKKVVLSDVCTINPPKANVKELPDYLEVSFFPMPALSEIYGAITEPQTRQLGEVRTGFTNFSEGDVVFAKITPCMENGKTAIIGPLVNHLGYGTTEFFVCRCSDKLYNRYLWHMFRDQHFRNEAKAVMSGAVGQQRVPKSFLENYRIELPSVAEQHEIVAVLDTMFEKELTAKEASEVIIEQINDMKESILARAFRGELGTNDLNDESAIELLKRIL